jgi:GST-like protein
VPHGSMLEAPVKDRKAPFHGTAVGVAGSKEDRHAIERYTNEAARLYGVMDERLSEVEYFAGGEYSIVDMAIYPWVASHERQGQEIEDYPNLERWYRSIDARPAVRRAMEVGEELRRR